MEALLSHVFQHPVCVPGGVSPLSPRGPAQRAIHLVQLVGALDIVEVGKGFIEGNKLHDAFFMETVRSYAWRPFDGTTNGRAGVVGLWF